MSVYLKFYFSKKLVPEIYCLSSRFVCFCFFSFLPSDLAVGYFSLGYKKLLIIDCICLTRLWLCTKDLSNRLFIFGSINYKIIAIEITIYLMQI